MLRSLQARSATEARKKRNRGLSCRKEPFLVFSAVECKKRQVHVRWCRLAAGQELSAYRSRHATWDGESSAYFASRAASPPGRCMAAHWQRESTTLCGTCGPSAHKSVKETRGEPACRLARAGVGVDSILPLSLSSPFSGLFLASSLGAFDNLMSSIIGTHLSTLPQLLPGHEGGFFTLLTTLVPLPLDSNPGAG